jgi:type III secretion system low calcium response chaperone LcrH/SycD
MDTKEQELTLPTPYLDPSTTEALYNVAYEYFRQGQYHEAIQLFRFLTMLHPMDKLYWNGLANSLQENEQFKDAIEAYALSAFIDPESPSPYFHAAGCYLSLGAMSDAMKSLLQAKEKTTENPLLLKQISLLQQAWKPKRSKSKDPS